MLVSIGLSQRYVGQSPARLQVKGRLTLTVRSGVRSINGCTNVLLEGILLLSLEGSRVGRLSAADGEAETKALFQDFYQELHVISVKIS